MNLIKVKYCISKCQTLSFSPTVAAHRWSSPVSQIYEYHNRQRKGYKQTIHKENSNKMQQCINISLFHIYMKLNTFRATHRPSSGA